MKIILCLCLLWIGILFFPGQVFANASPGLSSVGSLIVLLLTMVFVTAVGGGYAISRKIRKEKKGRLFGGPISTTLVTLTVLFGVSTVENFIIATLFVGVLVMYRAFKLATLSRAARGRKNALLRLSKMLKSPIKNLFSANSSAKRAHEQENSDSTRLFLTSVLEGANPSRLALASWLLMAATVILVPATITFGWQSGSYAVRAHSGGPRIVNKLRGLTAEEIRIRKAPSAETRKEELLALHERYRDSFHSMDYSRHKCIFTEILEGHKFTIFLVPTNVSFFTPAISFRADESGKIRAAKVYSADVRCPEDAEVIADVHEPEKDFYPFSSL